MCHISGEMCYIFQQNLPCSLAKIDLTDIVLDIPGLLEKHSKTEKNSYMKRKYNIPFVYITSRLSFRTAMASNIIVAIYRTMCGIWNRDG